jgi:hypothetical protein
MMGHSQISRASQLTQHAKIGINYRTKSRPEDLKVQSSMKAQ